MVIPKDTAIMSGVLSGSTAHFKRSWGCPWRTYGIKGDGVSRSQGFEGGPWGSLSLLILKLASHIF